MALENVQVEVSAVIGARQMALKDVLSLRPGTLIAMGDADGRRLSLTVGGKTLLAGALQPGPDGVRQAVIRARCG